eukprot:TRINITY_DN572_c0_g1_i1.p1 TRINITY_DN572_c0_g1~~TRINITY_DN572_c0_g1_i1.p1  ORF type:complete len:445 (+),score=23.06 TRINITY_DN572_c0_g1_i1:172-1506(+)
MGNQQSSQDCIYTAAKTGNIKKLQEYWRQHEQMTADQKRQLLEWRDTEGRTALIVAASRGHFEIVQNLLSHGADAMYIAPVSVGGSALHEAVMGRHKNIVSLLLRRGLNPFVENQRQQTALGYAIESCNVNLIRMMEKLGIYWGWMLVKIKMIVGSRWKLRWCVVVPYHSCPTAPAGLRSHALLLIYTDQSSYEPRIKAWIDNSRVQLSQRNSNDFLRAKLTLQAGHAVPNSAHTQGRPETGVSLFFKSYDHSSESKEMVTRFSECVNNNWLQTVPHPYAITSPRQNGTPIAGAQPGNPNAGIQAFPREPQVHHLHVQSQENIDLSLEQFNHNEREGTPSAPSQGTSQQQQHVQQPQASTSMGTREQQQQQQVLREYQQLLVEQEREDEQLCVVCLSEPKSVGLAHGETVHKCLCVECSKSFERGQPCPICKQPIDLILKKFFE